MLHTTARMVNFNPSFLRLFEEGRPDPKADAVHEQVIEERLGEVVELELHAIVEAHVANAQPTTTAAATMPRP